MRQRLLREIVEVCRFQLSDRDCQSVLNYARVLAQDSVTPPSCGTVHRLTLVPHVAYIDQGLTSSAKRTGS